MLTPSVCTLGPMRFSGKTLTFNKRAPTLSYGTSEDVLRIAGKNAGMKAELNASFIRV